MKKMINIRRFIISIAMITTSFSLSASQLEHWLNEEVQSGQDTLVEIEKVAQQENLFLNLIRVRFRATLSLELPLIAKGKVRPEIELYYSR